MIQEAEILTDARFWGRLARLANSAMQSSPDIELRRHWIDDLLPEACKSTNDGLQVEGIAYVMGNKNGRFGKYRFYTTLPWRVVRHRDRAFALDQIGLSHADGEVALGVVPVTATTPSGRADPSR